jgi:tetratricopeptide (TPR) repeat protein
VVWTAQERIAILCLLRMLRMRAAMLRWLCPHDRPINITVFMEEHAMQRSISRHRAKMRPGWTPWAVMVAILLSWRPINAQQTSASIDEPDTASSAPTSAEPTAAPGDQPRSARATPTVAPSNQPRSAKATPTVAPSVQPHPASALPTPFATAFDDPGSLPETSIDPATLGGVRPGETTAAQLAAKWGEGKPISQTEDGTVLRFSVESYKDVEVTLVEDRVRLITVQLSQPLSLASVRTKLQLNQVRPVDVPGESGELLGQAFPERGVLLSFSSDGKRVSQIVLEPIDLESFVARAEADWQSHTRTTMADLTFVLERQPHNAKAHYLKAKVLELAARYDEAVTELGEALSAETDEPAYHLTRAEILGRQGKYEEAAQEAKDILAGDDLPDDLKAQALCLLGDLLAASPAHDYKQALEHHMAAIKLADPLSVDQRMAVRRAAKLLLIDAHLAVANDIACGNWQQKEKTVTKWLDRANAFAEDFVAQEGGEPLIRLHIAHGALAACAGAAGKIDSVPWARMAIQNAKPVLSATTDPWTRARLEWELGEALSDGLASDEARGTLQHALSNTSLTITYLESGAKERRETPDDAFRLGMLYYKLGLLHAQDRSDHKTAVVWFDKAVPLLTRPIPPTKASEEGHCGQWLVSMGISYWEVGTRDLAVQLTDAGRDHIEQAVKAKVLDDKALAVPYGNLAFMHKALGHQDNARDFAQLAAKYDAAAATLKR